MAAPSQPTPAKRRKHPLAWLLFWLLIAAAAGFVLEVRGPYQGWFRRLLRPESALATADAGRLSDAGLMPDDMPAVDSPLPTPTAADAAPRTDLEMLYDRRYQEILEKLKPAEIGKKYKLRLRNRQTIVGKLIEVSAGQIRLAIEYGTITMPLNQVDRALYPLFFPERAAKIMALRAVREEIKKRRRERKAALATASGMTGQSPVPDVDSEEPTASNQLREQGPLRYDPEPGPTPAHLQSNLEGFGQWLKVQQRRLGVKIIDRVYARESGRHIVLYINVNDNYLSQGYDWRFQMAESIWKFWSFRCQAEQNLFDLRDVHVVLTTPDLEIIGGSNECDGADIWVAASRKSTRRRS